jgi:biopolymer transport protein ExbB/TolQ
MTCTAFGLRTAVPILVVHALLQTKRTELMDSLETAGVKFMNALAARQSTRTQAHLELVKAAQAS